MKILQLGKFWPILGGVEKVMVDLAGGLTARGVACDMLCAVAEGEPQEIPLNGCGKVFAVPTLFKAKSTMISPAMIERLRHIAADYDIIHVHHPDPMAALALKMSGYKGKVVLHWHSDILRQRMLLKAYRPLQSWLLDRADRVICTSPNYAAGSKELKRVADKLQCVPIGIVPVRPDRQGAGEWGRRLGDRKVVFSLGRLIPYKGFDNLILASRSLPDDYVTVIAGSGPLKEKFEKLIAEKDLKDKVLLLGRISDEDRDALMGAASVFVLPSVEKTEAFGIVLIEAMSAGVPVVATKIPGSGTSWVNADGISGINVACNDPEALARAIIKVVDPLNHPDSFAVNARRRWEELFTMDRFIDNIAQIYRSL